jgi:hypothetical protein
VASRSHSWCVVLIPYLLLPISAPPLSDRNWIPPAPRHSTKTELFNLTNPQSSCDKGHYFVYLLLKLIIVTCILVTYSAGLGPATKTSQPKHQNRKYTIQINQPTRRNSFTSLLLDVYVWLNMFRSPPRPSSGARICTSNLWFYRWRVAVAALLVVVWQVMPARPRPTTLQPPLSNGNNRGS